VSSVDWNLQLAEQLDWHWREQLRPRLDGLTDAEYRWEPVPGAWNVRPRGTGTAPIEVGAGEFVLDFAFPQPVPPPVTTIAWRLGHMIVGVLGTRVASHFGGPVEGPYAKSSMAELVLHINREMLHHGAEVALLRDLYLWHFGEPG
jgi:hypothetical protein